MTADLNDDVEFYAELPPEEKVELVILEAFDPGETAHPVTGEPVRMGRLLRELREEIARKGGICDIWGHPHPADLSDWANRDPENTYLRTLFRPVDPQ